tara:strand:+ start:549 stop:830 length:282 start_codon:yes stop_codon:yes gene_type:complete
MHSLTLASLIVVVVMMMMVTEKKVSHTLAAIPLQSQQCMRTIVSLRSCPSRVLSLRAHVPLIERQRPERRVANLDFVKRERRRESVPGIVRVF